MCSLWRDYVTAIAESLVAAGGNVGAAAAHRLAHLLFETGAAGFRVSIRVSIRCGCNHPTNLASESLRWGA